MFKNGVLCALLLCLATVSHAGGVTQLQNAFGKVDTKMDSILTNALQSAYKIAEQNNNDSYRITDVQKNEDNTTTTVISKKTNEKLLFVTIKPDDPTLHYVDIYNLKTDKKKMTIKYSSKKAKYLNSYTFSLFDENGVEVQTVMFSENKTIGYVRVESPQYKYKAEAYYYNNGEIRTLEAYYYHNNDNFSLDPKYGVSYTRHMDGTEDINALVWTREEALFHIIYFQENITDLTFNNFFTRPSMTAFLAEVASKTANP